MAMLVLGVAVGQDATILAGPERDPVDAIPQGVAHDWYGCAGHRAHHLAGQSAEVLEGKIQSSTYQISSPPSRYGVTRNHTSPSWSKTSMAHLTRGSGLAINSWIIKSANNN